MVDDMKYWMNDVRRRLNKITQGEWRRGIGHEVRRVAGPGEDRGKYVCHAASSIDDAEFIAHAPEDLRRALDIIEKHAILKEKT